MLFGNKTKQVESAIDHKKADKLIALAKDKDEAVALAAVKGLGEIGDPHAKAHISGVLKFEKDTATIQAMHAAMAKIADY